ncbi:hypothetical protein [Thalassomonas haliotis]|uniref:Uncharacterized protein n=1 Tax=Thalassomonas haliotis TaxID=485448 RepID=A0ABY7VIP4_9GAMM|nr:hypothetical protein [Thalassomonas haliotis]WDE13029.1 hypothetical protein H3N35_06120 [Thalassomonas haliotis]
MIFKVILFKILSLFNTAKTSRLIDMIDFYRQLKYLAISQWDVETKEHSLDLARLRQQNQLT